MEAQSSPPSLSVSELEDDTVELSWPATAADFFLESAADLNGLQPWQRSSQTPRLDQGRYSVLVLAADAASFFRLRQESSPLPPDPATVAPPLAPGVASDVGSATEFLYQGANPIQTGVTGGTIQPDRAAVLRGRVRQRDGAALAGVRITVLNHPEFGQTLTRADGWFDLAVNGGGALTVRYERSGFCPAQRQVPARPQDYSVAPEVVMVELDPAATSITFGANAPAQTHEATRQTDLDGSRRATLLFPAGTVASLVMPDGTQVPRSGLTIRATEFTVGTNGPAAMPAPLPPNSAYTYCVELSADEAMAAGAARVQFDRNVWFYVENFLNFPVGIEVPVGFYDAGNGVWTASQNGRVIKVLNRAGGSADLDVDGDGAADPEASLATLDITPAERQQLAARYATGQSLWRFPVPHFSTVDANWPGGPGGGAPAPNGGPPVRQPPPDHDDDPPAVYLQSQRVFERVPIAGTPFSLTYDSSRAAGYRAANRLRIPVSGPVLPASVQAITLEVSIAGRSFTQEFAPAPNLVAEFEWDGRDAYGREVRGAQPATVRIANVFRGVYQGTSRFGLNGEFELTGNPTRAVTEVAALHTVPLGTFDVRRQSVGGWTLDVHHLYDPGQRRLYLGDGSMRSADSIHHSIATAVGSGQPYTAGFTNDGIRATEARLLRPAFSAVAADGTLYFSDANLHQLFRVDREGILHTVAGIARSAGYNGDERPAATAQLNAPFGIALAPDGTIYFNDGANFRTRSITPDGVIHTVAGNGQDGYSGDGGPATAARTRLCVNLSRAEDGTLFISDSNNHAIRRVGTDGIITTAAGTGERGFSGDGGPATAAQLSFPLGAGLDREGNLFIVDSENRRIRRVGLDGRIATIAGDGTGAAASTDAAGDGGPAVLAKIGRQRPGFFLDPNGLRVDREGNILFTDGGLHRIRKITRDGIITSVAGSGNAAASATAPNGDGGAALQASFGGPTDVSIGPDGSLFIADETVFVIRRVTPPLPGFSGTDIAIPSEDGLLLYRFDANGRHRATMHALTGAALFTFDYNANGQIARVSDAHGNVTTIQRDAAGDPVAIVGPYGHQTALAADAGGSLAMIRDPLGGTYHFTSTGGGLLTSETDPVGNVHTFAYDSSGLLTRADPAGPGWMDLARVEMPDGYVVGTTSALGATGQFPVERRPNGDEVRRNTASTGLVVETVRSVAGIHTTTGPDGSVSARTFGPDPRFGLQAPVEANDRFTTPGGKTLTLATSRAATLSDPQNPLSLAALSETVSVNGAPFVTTYDAATRDFVNTTAAGRQSRSSVDTSGRTVALQFGDLHPTAFRYDTRSRLSALEVGGGDEMRRTAFAYNADGQLDAITDPLLNRWGFAYDAAGRVTQRHFPDGGVLGLGYDASGNLTSVAPPGRAAHELRFNEQGQIASYTAPDAGGGPAVTTFRYNAHHALTQVERPGGETITYGYDSGGRVTTRTVAAGATTFAYDPNSGALASATGPSGDAVAHLYDGPFELATTWTGTVAGTVSRTLDDQVRTATQRVNDGGTVAFTYDADWLLVAAGPLTLTRDPQRGIVTGTTLAQVTDTRSFNAFGELDSYTAAIGGTPLFALQHRYDANGRVTQKVEAVGAEPPDTWDYAYDAIGRLVEVKKNGLAQSAWTYDANGNRLTAGGVPATYDAQDRLLAAGVTTFSYKPSGDLLSKTADGQTTTYAYDALGSLTAVRLPDGSEIGYVMDGHNRRIGRKVNGVLKQGFLYQDGLHVVAELDGDQRLVSRFVYADRDGVPAFMIRNGVTYRILADPVGSVRLVVDAASGAIAQRLDYDAFGQVLADTNPGFQPFGFAGGLYDPDTRLVRFGARDYDASVGRWTAKDPLVFAGRESNLYAYAANDPVNAFDPDGLDVVSIGFYHAVIISGHTTISVNGSPFQGFYPDNGGAIVFEGQKLKRNPDYRIRFNVTPDQARRIKKFIADQKKKGRAYDLFSNNCTHFVWEALEAGGIVGTGRGVAYSPSQLFRELMWMGGSFTF